MADELNISILLVDDHPDGLLALETVLASQEYQLVKASSGQEALRYLLDQDFALVLLDVKLPDLNGFEVATLMKKREKSKDIPIIFLTALNEDNSYVYRGYDVGAFDYLFKPFDPNILKSKVGTFVELFRKNQQIRKQADQLKQNEQAMREKALANLELESLQRYRNLTDAMPHMVWQAQPDGILDYFNQTWRDYTGLTVEQGNGKGWQSTIHPDDLKPLLLRWQKAIESGEPEESECRIRRARDGVYRWHLIRTVPEKRQSGQVISWLGTGTDIHFQKEIEEELRKAREAALDASSLKSEFLANISHEIRTPLNGVIATTDLLLHVPLNEAVSRLVKTIRQSGNTLLTLINDVLDFSRMEASKLELEITPFSPLSVVETQGDILAAGAHEKNLGIMTYVSPEVPPVLLGDSGRIAQVLMNLIGNAIKFTESGKVVVRATLDPSFPLQDPATVALRFSVTDTGVGVPDAIRHRLFQPFSQADGSTVRRFGGTGLGLSICKHLIDLMQGQIGFDSKEGKESTFWFTVALKVDGALPVIEKAPSVNPNIRALVVNPDPVFREIVQAYLRNQGIECWEVANATSAFAFLCERAKEATPITVCIIDQNLPEMDGLEWVRTISSEPLIQGLRFILTTRTLQQTLLESGRAAGIARFLTRPIKQLELLDCVMGRPAIESHLDSRSVLVPTTSPDNAKTSGSILLVEDNPVMQMVTVLQLVNLGYYAHSVANGREAIEEISRTPYDLVLMDCQMPEMDGFEATRMIRKKEIETGSSPIRIVALTAHAMKGDDKRCLDAGMNNYVCKPITIDQLSEVIESEMKKRSENPLANADG